MVSQLAFVALLAALGVQRLFELRLSRRNEAKLLRAGGREHAARHFQLMTIVHGSWFGAMLLEVFLLEARFEPSLAALGLLLAGAGQCLRYAAIRSLGWRWSVRIITVPGLRPVQHGIYRYLRHPNYLGVILELAGVPLIHGAYRTALAWTVFNALLLAHRIREEERALAADNRYAADFGDLPRFVPGLRR